MAEIAMEAIHAVSCERDHTVNCKRAPYIKLSLAQSPRVIA